MTPTQIALVQQSFRKLSSHQDDVADLFYRNLFDRDPSLKPLFKGDLKAQGRKLMTMLALVVAGLERLETLLPAVRELGSRHRGYGVQQRDYDTVGAALLLTLEQGLGTSFSPPVRDAWATAYGTLASTMIAAAAMPRQAAA